jgi:tetratricopeptide (TPR) repeat protein
MGKKSPPKRRPKKPAAPAPEPRPSAFEFDPKKLEESLTQLKQQLLTWAKQGRHTKVRFKFRGKQLLPDLPLAAVAAAEGLTFFWGGLFRALLVNLAGSTVFEVELVNDSERWLTQGKAELLLGEVDKALACFDEALAMDPENPSVQLNRGVAFKLKGDLPAARQALERAQKLDPEGAIGTEAERVLAGLAPPSSGR